ncbi:hypothetical protein SDC9_195467 [bioreactor metagenome]|uniref:Uncharacterized protein n=1 Tax=bioreactor metagenome TaxID=1076179 RepID=A0A645IKL3_9ZZZZ
MNRFVEPLYQRGHILPPPIVERLIDRRVERIGTPVVKISSRIEIIVHVDAVHIVLLHDFRRSVDDKRSHFGQSRIKVEVSLIGDDPLRMQPGGMVFGQAVKRLRRGQRPTHRYAIGVNPRVKLQPARVCFVGPVRERVKAILRRKPRFSRQIGGPRETFRLIQRVRRGAHL